MKQAIVLGAVVAAVAGAAMSVASGQDGGAAPIYGVKLPDGYRDWPMVSIASVGAPQNDLRAKLANAIAMKAFRDGTRPFPDGSIIVRLAYRQATSELNNKVFRAAGEKQGVPTAVIEKMLASSFVAGAPTNVQVMVKDSKKYASSGGWGFGEFTAGKPDGEAVHKTCFVCHAPGKDQDFVFTQYAP
ncbi:MAG: cytochrome P460 family protein [Alphaproteobacteria bacterium]|nr:cytochrome P460 family protein [Alphaproteobacteria bacterium]